MFSQMADNMETSPAAITICHIGRLVCVVLSSMVSLDRALESQKLAISNTVL
jgi:hypothetical protein